MAVAAPELRPQPGPQEEFLACSADIAIYGGAAGGGKSYGLLLDDLYHLDNPRYDSVTFRRTFPQITNPGGLWDTSLEIYPHAGGRPNQSSLLWKFPSGASVKFAHMQYEGDRLQWQGSQIPAIKFDELDHFTESMFFYMLSRNRSASGIRPYIRATCNANAESWVADLIAWWIDQDTGFPIPDRAGQIRWFVRDSGQMLWADKASDLPWTEVEVDGEMVAQPPKSLTFIPAKVTDNKALLSVDPGYLSNLLSLPLVEQGRLLDGNWKIRRVSGDYFKREWFEIVDQAPADARRVRYWDLAATEAKSGPDAETKKKKDPDFTAGALLAEKDGQYWICDMTRMRGTPQAVENLVRQTAELDGRAVDISMEQEPGSSGVNTISHYARNVLKGFSFKGNRTTGSKVLRAKPASSAAENSNIKLVRGLWNAEFLEEATGFPAAAHDDQVDALSGAFEMLTQGGLPFAWLRNDPEFRERVLPQPETDDERIARRRAAQGL